MALTIYVEDGSIVENANSYLSIADMKDYWDNWGHDYSELSDAEINLLLYRSAESLDTQYYEDWPGYRADEEQTMEWPRSCAYYQDGQSIDSDTIPTEVKKAQAYICYLKNQGDDLQPTVNTDGTLRKKRERVEGAVEVEYVYDNYSGAYTETYLMLSNILRRLIGFTGRYGKLNLQRD